MSSEFNIIAWQYVLGELSQDDVAAFESRLEIDQAAREALADAVVLMSALRQTPAVALASREQAPVAAGRSRLLAVACCVAAGVLVALVLRLPGRTASTVALNASDDSSIVGTWSELAPDDALQVELSGEAMSDDASDIPDWVVAAVLGEVDSAPHDEGTL
jgi:anti-sigma factor RsiW